MSSEPELPNYVDGEYLKPDTIEDREYQSRLVDSASKESTLLALPTGTGKTPVAIRIASRQISENKGSKVLMLAPTNPLIEQHAESFKEMTSLPESEIMIFNGKIRPDKREKVWGQNNSVIIATPQVIENDLVANRYDLSNVSHLIFDECHRATGDYAYNYIGERYERDTDDDFGLVTAMSASPGSNKEKILEVCENLSIDNVEVITEDDADLQKHQSETEVETRWLDMPEELLEAADLLKEAYKEPQKQLKQIEITIDDETKPVLSSARKDQTFGAIQGAMGRASRSEESQAYQARSYCAEAMKLHKIIESIESQSVDAAIASIERAIEEGRSSGASNASQRIASNPKVQQALKLLRDFEGVHPKLTQIILESSEYMHGDGRVLVFTDSRDTVNSVVDFLNSGSDTDVARKFVGQNDRKDDDGLSQKEQKQVLEDFRNEEFSIMVSTSVGEEGIDIPAVDLVIFYEPVPSGIRSIQRRGRTGREHDGKVITLIGKDTADIPKYYNSQNKEEEMRAGMEELKEMEEDLNTALREIRGLPAKEEQPGETHKEHTESEEFADESDGQSALTAFDNESEDTDTDTEPDGSEATEETSADKDAVSITIDQREFNSDVPKELDRNTSVVSTAETLPTADYVVSDRAGIERKDGADFLDTILGERGFGQIKELANAYDRPAVFIEEEGISDLFSIRNVHPNAIRGALASIQLDYGVTVYFTGDEEGTAEMLVSLAKREQLDHDREVDAHGQKETTTLSEQQVYIVSSIAGVGPKTAKKLLEDLGSVREVMTATVDELQSVDGVGETRAEEMVDVVSAEYTPN